jgi:ornithine carbamoyltransferase
MNNQKKPKHFLDIADFTLQELRFIVERAKFFKSNLTLEQQKQILPHKTLAMIFEKTSTRTRISFEVAINHLGGSAIVLNKADTQLGKGETIADTSKVLSRMVDAVMIRCYNHQTLLDFASSSNVSVINGLTDFSHPCQVIASIMAIEEKLGDVANLTLTWFGDANNVLNSYIQASSIFNFTLQIAKPDSYIFCDAEIAKAKEKGAKIIVGEDANSLAKNSDVLISDTWVSMGDIAEGDVKAKQQRISELKSFQINKELLDSAKPNAIFTHCLPIYRGYEVTAEVADGVKSIIFDEAENRLHAQKAILEFCLKTH